MKYQSIGMKALLAVILFFQAETSQARTVKECTDCTSKSCQDADDKEWCVNNCDLGQIPNCLKVTPRIKNVNEANRYGNIRRIELLHEIYQEFPLVKYFLDLKTPIGAGKEEGGTLSNEEKKQLKGALQKLEKGCQDIVVPLEYSKGRTLSAKDQMDIADQMKDLLVKVKNDFENINENLTKDIPKKEMPLGKIGSSDLTFIPTRHNIKIALDKASLNVKNCFNQGEGAIFKSNQKEKLVDKVITKFNCKECTAKNCAKTLKSEYILVARMQPFQKKDKPVKGRIYLKKDGEKLNYIVRLLGGEVVSEKLDITINEELTPENLEKNKSQILTGISKKGHITTAYDDCREKCPAYRIESCLEAGSKARSH